MKTLAALVFGLVGAFAAWTLLTWFAIGLHWPPAGLYAWRIPVIAFLFLAGVASAALAMVVIPQYTTSSVRTGPPGAGAAAMVSRGDWVILAGLATLMWTMNGLVQWPNPDDTHFLDAAASFLVEPGLPLFATDTLFQVHERPNYVYALNLGQSWDALTGFVARVTGINLLVVYYTVLPLFTALLVPLVTVLFGKLLGLSRVAPGAVVAVVGVYLLAEFGGALAAKFQFMRLFQGKSAMILAGLPLCMLAGMLLARLRSTGSMALLLVAVLGTAGTSSTGLYMAPLAAGMGALMGLQLKLAALSRTAIGLVIAGLPCLLALLVFHVMRDTGDLMANYDYRRFRFPDALDAFGEGWKGLVQYSIYALAALAVTVVGVVRRNSAIIRLGLVTLLLGLNPWWGELLGALTGVMNLYWRIFWLAPVGILLMVLGAEVVGRLLPVAGHRRPGGAGLAPILGLSVLLLAAAATLAVIVGKDRMTAAHFNLTKVRPDVGMVVERLKSRRAAYADQEIILAAPENIARLVNHYPDAPRQLYLRRYYFMLIPPETDRVSRDEVRGLSRTLRRKRIEAPHFRQLIKRSEKLGVTHLLMTRQQVHPALLERLAGEYPLSCERVGGFWLCTL